MSNEQASGALVVKFSLGLDPSLDRVSTAGELNQAFRQKLVSELAQLLKVLGIPGRAEVEIDALADVLKPADGPMRVAVNGQVCVHSDTRLESILSYVSDAGVKAVGNEVNLNDWLHQLYEQWSQGPEVDLARLSDLLALICLETIKVRPSVLLGPSQAAAYANSLPVSGQLPETWPPDPAWLMTILSKVLDLRISIAELAKVGPLLADGLLKNRANEDIAEDLIAALRPDILEVQLPLSYLQEITTANQSTDHLDFPKMRDGLFYQLGLRFPEIRFALVEDLRPRSFRFKINDLTTLPRNGLSATQCFVNLTPAQLSLAGSLGTPATNPATRYESSVVDLGSAPVMEVAGFPAYTPMEYLILSAGAELIQRGASLLGRAAVESELEQLELAFPALVKAARSRLSVEQITRVLRYLMAEQISIRNLKLVLERILEYDYVVTHSSSYIVFDERVPAYREPPAAWLKDPANMASFIRIGMKRYLKHKYAPNGSLAVYLLSPEIEEIMSEYGIDKYERASQNEDEREKILSAVRAGVGDSSRANELVVIVTNNHVRPSLRELLYPEFPDHVILAYEELAPDLSLRVIDRISLGSD